MNLKPNDPTLQGIANMMAQMFPGQHFAIIVFDEAGKEYCLTQSHLGVLGKIHAMSDTLRGKRRAA